MSKTMAVKSRKVAAKKISPKKSTPSRAVTKAFGAEVVAETPDLMPPEVLKQLSQVEAVIGRLDRMPEAKLADHIKDWAAQAAEFSNQAVRAGASALVYAWACGRLLNAAKEDLGHGAFGKWRREHLESAGISERTSTRYMKLAERCSDVKGLLQWAPTLKQAYVGCGVLPEPPKGEKDEQHGDESDEEKQQREKEEQEMEVRRKKEVLLASVSALQQRLHQGIGVKKNLDAGEIRQLKLARIQINSFFDQILGQKR